MNGQKIKLSDEQKDFLNSWNKVRFNRDNDWMYIPFWFKATEDPNVVEVFSFDNLPEFVGKYEREQRQRIIDEPNKPRHLPLDRDRAMPGSFDVNWATSKILEASKKMEVKDLSHSDTAYLEDLPEHVIERFKPVKIGNSINFTYKDDEGKTQVLANDRLKAKLQQHNFFQAAINKLKKFLAKQLGLYDLLKQFRDKHVHTAEALQDFNIILDRIEKA